MTKDHWMYVAIGAAIVAAYMYNEKQKILKSLKGVSGLPTDVAAQVAKL